MASMVNKKSVKNLRNQDIYIMNVTSAICPICDMCTEGSFYERSYGTAEMLCPYCNMWVYGEVVDRCPERSYRIKKGSTKSKSKEEGRMLRSVKFIQRLFRKKKKNALIRKKLLLKEIKKEEALSKRADSEVEKSRSTVRRNKKEVAETSLMGAENTRALRNNYTKKGVKSLRKTKNR